MARALRRGGWLARGIRVKVRFSRDFSLATRQATLDQPADDTKSLEKAALPLLDKIDLDVPIRLVGAAAFDLQKASASTQLALFGQEEAAKRSELEHTVDAILDKFGDKIRVGG